jgi:hypothetical protein
MTQVLTHDQKPTTKLTWCKKPVEEVLLFPAGSVPTCPTCLVSFKKVKAQFNALPKPEGKDPSGHRKP